MNAQLHWNKTARLVLMLATLFTLVVGTLFGPSISFAAPPAQEVTSEPGINFRNEMSSDVVCYLYIKPSSQYVWGNDRLGERVLFPAEVQHVPLLPGRYDVQVVGCDGGILAETYNMEVTFLVPLSIADDGLGVG